MSTIIDDWRTWLAASDLSPETIRLRTYQLTRFELSHPDLLAVTVKDLASWLGGHDWATNTRRSQRTALRGFYGWAHASGLVQQDPSRLLPRIREQKRKPRPAPEAAIRAGLATPERRVQIMLTLGHREGLRRGEIALVHSDDLIPDLTGWSLLVHGKGRKERIVPLSDDVAAMLLALPKGWAFPGLTDGHLSAGHVGVLMARALPGNWTGHTLRHAFATKTYRKTHNLAAVQELLGHASSETTKDYILVDDSELREVVNAAA